MDGIQDPGSIVVGVDTSHASMAALDWATALAQTSRTPLHLVHGFSPDRPELSFGMGSDEQAIDRGAHRVIDRAANRIQLRDRMIRFSTAISAGYPAAALVRASKGASLVVVGSHGDSMLHISSLGETAAQVAGHALCPVAVVRKDLHVDTDFKRITVGIDGSDNGTLALDWALNQAEHDGSDVLVIHAWQPRDARDPHLGSSDWSDYAQFCQDLVERHAATARAAHPRIKVLTEVLQGNPTRALVNESHASDIVVLGARGLGGFPGLHLGRVARDVLGHGACTVVIAR